MYGVMGDFGRGAMATDYSGGMTTERAESLAIECARFVIRSEGAVELGGRQGPERCVRLRECEDAKL
jgi:hypothetical protein